MSPRVLAFIVMAACLQASAASPASAATSLEDLRAAARKPPTEPAPALKLARDLRRSGLYKEAVFAARTGLGRARDKDDIAQLRFEIARGYAEQRQTKKALAECAPIAKASKLAERVCMAEVQLFIQRGSEALPIAEEALKVDPENYDALVAKGRALYQLGRPDDAQQALGSAVQKDTLRAEARRFLAEILRDRHQTDLALTLLREARRTAPDDPDVLILLGGVLQTGPEAIEVLEHAVAIRPNAAAAHAQLGQTMLAEHQLDRAESSLREALKLEPKHPEWIAALGRVSLERKHPDDALKAAHDALKIASNEASAKLVEANALAQKGDIDQAIAAFEAAYGMARSEPQPLVDAVRACLTQKRLTTAEAFAARAKQDFPDWAPAWEVAGDVAVARGEKAAARKAYDEASRRKGPVDKAALKRKIAAVK